MSDRTRRELLVGLASGGVLAGSGSVRGQQGRRPEEADPGRLREPGAPVDGPRSQVRERDRESTWPLVTYYDYGEGFTVTMPVNVRVHLRGSRFDVERVRDVFRYDYRWSPIVTLLDPFWPWHVSPPQLAWDAGANALRAPVASYRQPYLFRLLRREVGLHVYLWPVREDGELVGVAIQAHKDVGTVWNHVGGDYTAASGVVAETFRRRGWRTEGGRFEYGVDAGQRDYWGPTGDVEIYPPDLDG